MPAPILPLFDDTFLRARWDAEFEAFRSSPAAAALDERLGAWVRRDALGETASEAAFLQRFFVETWGYRLQGATDGDGYTCRPQLEVARAGQGGGSGFADVALGLFGADGDHVPQVLGEFKDVRSGLDARQHRKGNDRSPVDQAFDYLHEAFQSRSRDALATPSWAIVTDMREFRLYARLKGKAQCQRFVLADEAADPRAPALLGASEAATFRRFVFWRLFQPDLLLAERGASLLDGLLRDQVTREKAIETTFYQEYRAYRDVVYRSILDANPGFSGTRGKLVRLTQRFLDRCIFVLFCEDMGRVLRYPPELLRDLLIEYSASRFYNPEGSAPWDGLRDLFRAMRDGGTYGEHAIDRFNGGLFEEDPELETLRIPARVFCARGQGVGGDATLRAHPTTLLYFSATYNFGLVGGSGARAISLYTLGRIFEQSITELEIMEAEADGRVSLNRLTKRKCDGVYYTPEWVTQHLVEHTVGARMADLKRELGQEDLPPLDDAAIAEYRAFQRDKRRTARVAGRHREFLDAYRARLDRLRVVDPACGSGAFLIQALNRLLAEYRWLIGEQQRLEGHAGLFDQDTFVRAILSHNLYGVDINPESVEITKLALWLHTASPGQPLCALDHNIRCGNSLVGTDFYATRQLALFPPEQQERVNAFDWREAFPEVFARGGFDCVVGNPPYIKLQHFRRAQAEVADYLVSATRADGAPVYDSTRSGNFDMYLPFIEKGVELLRPEGRMGYIAPNVWMVNEYGQALRAKLKRTRALERWLDFKSHQIFEEAITYTALQFFRGTPSDAIACAFAPDGAVGAIDWTAADRIPYADLPDVGAWNLVPERERRLLDKLRASCAPLGSKTHTQQIFQGLITSADDVYHLERLASGRYATRGGTPVNVEDGLMRTLVSGPDAKRYQVPRTNTWLIFPYTLEDGRPRLYTLSEMEARFRLGIAYLRRHEAKLRARENGAFDDDAWYRFGRNQNIDKQELPKLCVAQTVPSLRVCYDSEGAFYFNNVRVNGVLPHSVEDGWFLLGVLNAPVCDFVFRRIAKPKEGGYFEANKQFIAPLPIPDATPDERREICERARALQDGHTRRRDLVEAIQRRLDSPQCVPQHPKPGPDWLWADIGTVAAWKRRHPSGQAASAREISAWAKAQHEAALAARLIALDALLVPGARLRVEHTADQLALSIDGIEALRLYDKPDTPFVAAQWRHALRDANVTEAFDGRRLMRQLLDIRVAADAGLRDRIVALDAEIAALDADLASREAALNAILYRLYALTPEEIALVEGKL